MPARLTAARVVAAALAVAFATACRSEADEAARAEAGRVAHAVQVLRDAPNAAKPALRKALADVSCVTADVCALKNACNDAYALQEQALSSVSVVKHAVDVADAGARGHAALLLEVAQGDLRRAMELAVRCADLEAAARRRYGL